MRVCAQACLTLCKPLDYNPAGSSVHGISQARILECIAAFCSRGSSQSRDWTHGSCIADGFFAAEPLQKPEAPLYKHRQHLGGRTSIYEFGKNVNIQSRTVQNEYDIITCLQRFFSVQKIKGDTLKKKKNSLFFLLFVYSTTLSIYCVSSLGYKNCSPVP